MAKRGDALFINKSASRMETIDAPLCKLLNETGHVPVVRGSYIRSTFTVRAKSVDAKEINEPASCIPSLTNLAVRGIYAQDTPRNVYLVEYDPVPLEATEKKRTARGSALDCSITKAC